jgi:hypothetical protein
MPERRKRWPRDRAGEWASAGAYGTVLVLAALMIVDASDISSGLGWELVTGVGLATWLAHLYAEVVGDQLRQRATLGSKEIAKAMADGIPILLAAVPPAVMLFLGRVGVLDEDLALGASFAVAFLQLVGVGAFVGSAVSSGGPVAWAYAVATAGIGLAVVTVEFVLVH